MIPKTIYQTWKTQSLPEKVSKIHKKSKKLNKDYNHIIYTDEQMNDYINSNVDKEIANVYWKMKHIVAKADIWRYSILFNEGGIYVDIDSWPVIGGSMTLGNVLFDNQADNGNQLYRDYESDTITWTPIYAHHNYFNICPPGINEVYPPSGWDLDNCHLIAELGVQELMPKDEISLLQNYPNPFNFSTNITIVLNSEKLVDIVIYDVGGRVVFSKKYKLNSGKNIVQWNALGQPSGLYLISAIGNNYSMTRKAIFVK